MGFLLLFIYFSVVLWVFSLYFGFSLLDFYFYFFLVAKNKRQATLEGGLPPSSSPPAL
jgi:hypothetical protein